MHRNLRYYDFEHSIIQCLSRIIWLQAFEWRAKNKIDNILDENWKKWEQQFPYHLIVDKEGRPGTYLSYSTVSAKDKHCKKIAEKAGN